VDEGDLLVCVTVADFVLFNVSEYPCDMLGIPNPVTQCHILEDLNPEEKWLWKLQISKT
jgi:hypothetical protein